MVAEDDKGTSLEPSGPCDPTLSLGYSRWRSLGVEPQIPEINLTPETSRPCAVKHCRTQAPLPEVYRWKTCATCRARARRDARRKRDAFCEIDSQEPSLVSPFQTYQNRTVLLSSLGTQLGNFVEGQTLHLRSKPHESGEGEPSKLSPMAFAFDGEYSVVTASRGEGSSQSQGDEVMAMREEVHGVVEDLNCVLRTKLKGGEAFAIDTGGVIMRFTCSFELIAPLRPLPLSAEESETPLRRSESGEIEEEKSPSAVPLIKTSGELEVAIVPDNSHRLFHGRRTIIRYHMLG
ncbi:hypothetical protein PAXRUDRAFT_140487 [Paxillus rubicundulus Ve08.2h10]|uniref:Uncharacterized protein n=1 Tax=Paxillus rubicundulus Ve08.2h10 TaxID=930991 RepID=A0A0D0DRE5_9AGAM|nr:hypothetical protein PAXRUDRAFT_140487 [Paxillus rubicundulus Ve08.2h10]